MKSREYWIKRVANYTYTTYNSLEEKNIALMDMYDKAAKDISDELYAITEKIAQNGKVTRSDMHKFNRLTGLNKNINSILEQLTEDVKDNSTKSIIKAMSDVYKNVNVSLGNTKFDIPNKRVMEEMLNKPWQGSYFNKRLWGNTNKLAEELNSILTIGITQGKTIAEMSIQLKNATRKSFNYCHRLIRTETMSALNEASTRAYKDNGIEEVEVYCAVDERLCDTCGKYHKKKYPIDKCPHVPFHANCRCTVIPVIDMRKGKEDNSNKHVEKEYSKKEAIEHLKNTYGIEFKDSRKYPMNEKLLSTCVNWLDKFKSNYGSFIENNPCKIPKIVCNPPSKMHNSVGYYSYYPANTSVVELALNGQFHSNVEMFQEYVDKRVEIKWYPANAKIHKTFVHEYGHHVSNSLKHITENKRFEHDFITECIEELKKQDSSYTYSTYVGMENWVSRYGASSESELFAETFAEYFGGENPRLFARIFGEKLDKILKGVK